jgi:Na+-transporting NADH:ubiquinone oxidoreductase subunit C
MSRDNLYTFFFAAVVCVVCSFLLSLSSMGLKERQELNRRLDIRKNILKALNLLPTKAEALEWHEKNADGNAPYSYEKTLESIYNQNIKELVVDPEGAIIEGVSPADLGREDSGKRLALYQKIENNKYSAFVVPVSGKGLWSTIYGFIALEKDLKTVIGITFYEHAETPGLGAEIEQPFFTEAFRGKKIRDASGKLVSITVAKGKVENSPGMVPEHSVDGISGSTLTCNGVTNLIRNSLLMYEPYFSLQREG